MGVHAEALTDEAGSRLAVEEAGGGIRCEVRGPQGAVLGVAWRWPPPKESAASVQDGEVRPWPHLPGLSGVAVRDGSGLTVTWPAPTPSTGVPGAGSWLVGAPGGGSLGGPAAGGGDPVTDAWRRYEAEGRSGDLGRRLLEALERAVRISEEEGWDVVDDEAIDGPLDARVVRLRRPGTERSLTLSSALGVGSLVLIEKPFRAGGVASDEGRA